MSTFLTPHVRFNIIETSTDLPEHGPIDNIAILKQLPRMQSKSNAFLKRFADKIIEDFGFRERYWAHLPWQPLEQSRLQTAESLSYAALDKLFTKKENKQVDAFILGSTTNKRYTGSQACAVLGQHQIEAAAWDIKAGCSTSLASLQLAYSLMSLGYENVLVSCAETLSKVIDVNNELTWFGLADGAAALLLQSSKTGMFSTDKIYFSSQGQYVDAFTTQGLLPPTPHEMSAHGYALKGDETLLKKLAYDYYTKMLKKILADINLAEIKWIIPHQVNRKLIERLIHEHQIQDAELIWHAHKIGNIGGASILYSLAHAFENNVFNQDGKILMMSVGGGLTYSAQLLDYKHPKI